MNSAIIGIGNPLMGDDGVGLAVLEHLGRMPLPQGVDLVDGGTAGLGLLHILAGLDHAVLVDAVDFGGRPGEIRTFSSSDVLSCPPRTPLSPHGSDVLHVIALAARLGQCPRNVTLCGIQPVQIAPGCALSPVVEGKVSALAREARDRAAAGDSSKGRE